MLPGSRISIEESRGVLALDPEEEKARNEAAARKYTREQERIAAVRKMIAFVETKDDFLGRQEAKGQEAKLPEEKGGLKAQLVQQLSALLPEAKAGLPEAKASLPEDQAAAEAAVRAEAKKVEVLRSLIRTQILSNDTPEAKRLGDKAFAVELMLAEQWPNNLDSDTYELTCPLSYDTIPVGMRVPLGNYVYDRRELNKYFKSPFAYQLNALSSAVVAVRDQNRRPLTPRELAYLAKCKVRIDREEHISPLGSLASRSFTAISLLIDPIYTLFPRFRFFPIAIHIGAICGGAIGLLLSIFLVAGIIGASLTPISLPAVLGMAVLCGIVKYKRQEGVRSRQDFLLGFLSGFLGGAMAFLLAYLGPVLIAGLGAASLLSSTSVAAGTAIWAAIIQPVIPAVLGAVAAVREYFTPGAMQKTFDSFYYYSCFLPHLASIAAGAVAGAVLAAAVVTVVAGCVGIIAVGSSIASCFRRQQPADALRVAAAHEQGPQVWPPRLVQFSTLGVQVAFGSQANGPVRGSSGARASGIAEESPGIRASRIAEGGVPQQGGRRTGLWEQNSLPQGGSGPGLPQQQQPRLSQ